MPPTSGAANLLAILANNRIDNADNIFATALLCLGKVAIAVKCNLVAIDCNHTMNDYSAIWCAEHSYSAKDRLAKVCTAHDYMVVAIAEQWKHTEASDNHTKLTALFDDILYIIEYLLHCK